MHIIDQIWFQIILNKKDENENDYRDFSMLWRAVAVSWHSGASTECARAWRLENDDNEDYGDGDDGDGEAFF